MGSTYLFEVLHCEDYFLNDISLKINEIAQQTSSLKNDIRSIIDEGNINFKPYMKENTNLKSQAEHLIKDMAILHEQISSEIKPELSSCSLELKTLSKSLQEVNLSLYFLNQLIEIYSSIKKANIKMQNREFHECAKLIKIVQDLVKNDVNELKQLDMYKTLSKEAVISYEHLLYQLNELWTSYVIFDVKEEYELKLITLSVDFNSAFEISDILKALDCLQYALIEKKFINMFLHSIFYEIIMKKITIKEEVKEKAVLILEVVEGKEKPHYSEVFTNLIKVVNFLKKYFDLDIRNGTSFLHKIGKNIGNELAEKLITDCLTETIPSSSEDLENYNNVVRSTEEFEVTLKECGFLPEKTTCLIDYAKNINVLFANKFCQSYLEKARMLMKKDLYNTTTSEEIFISTMSSLPKSHRNILRNKLNIQEEDGFTYQKNQISKSAEEIINLVNEMVSELLRSQDMCAVRLFYTIRNIFEMYSAIVPLHHRKFLNTLPQQVALLHNNCMYFTYFLINLTCEYYKKIPAIPNDHFNIFLEEALMLRTLAVEKLEEHVTSQKEQLVFILRDSGIANLIEDPRLDPTTEKNIRQCIRQLQLLQSVWKDVLPLKVYNRAIGFLLDSIFEEIITLIMNVEDISSQTANDLASMFTIIIDRAQTLFQDPKQVFRHSKKWFKFTEFIGILKGSLRDIDSRWSDGMGPLASEFTAKQVKHLIRALFQNSERRSALLNRIE